MSKNVQGYRLQKIWQPWNIFPKFFATYNLFELTSTSMIIRNLLNHGLKVRFFKEENLLILFGHFSISVIFFFSELGP